MSMRVADLYPLPAEPPKTRPKAKSKQSVYDYWKATKEASMSTPALPDESAVKPGKGKKTAGTGTTYIVLQAFKVKPNIPGLKEDGAPDDVDVTSFGPSAWREVGRVTASSSEDAIKQVADQTEAAEVDVTAVAIPLRSWQPVKVKVQTITRLKLENA